MQVKDIVIVGGGSSGWMTAAALDVLCPHVNVTLIEDPNQGVIGVGESSLQQIRRFISLLGLKDSDWMKDIGATYKTAISFNDFWKKGESWLYPFGSPDEMESKVPWMAWFVLNATKPEKYTNDTFATTFNPVASFTKYNKLTYDTTYWKPWVDTAYHIDAIKFGQWLKNNVCKRVKHITGTVTGVIKKENGDIDCVVYNGKTLSADLFVDCSGFKSLLLGEAMDVPFESFHYNDGGCLLNDKAISISVPHENPEKEVTNTTNCTALDNGWVWDVPLWERGGLGYVYSSNFISEDEAQVELHNYLVKTRGKYRADQVSYRTIPFKMGKHKKSFVGNVIAVGLSNCFVEPLESTGLLVTHEQVIRLCNALSGRNGFIPKVEKEMINQVADHEIEGHKNFVAAHYAFSERKTDFWRTASEVVDYDFCGTDNLFMRYGSHKYINFDFLTNLGSIEYNDGPRYCAAGMGFNPINKVTLPLSRMCNEIIPEEDEQALTNAEKIIDEWHQHMLEYCETLPSSYEFLNQTIYKE
ncbi:tryptophan halogenase [Cyanophage P-RSM6]|uniref:tryptophan halogenase n=1 Tax=Cyanophage P-RSM6 TaxID=929832 RepID=UPI0002C1842F|nr:tryptophan halogenase [Cyanophage P-RSM6]AGH56986.1 tryptophan halogenase [Cyanophage P-RSM6]